MLYVLYSYTVNVVLGDLCQQQLCLQQVQILFSDCQLQQF